MIKRHNPIIHCLQEIHFRGPERKKSRKMYSVNGDNMSRKAYTYPRQNMHYNKYKKRGGRKRSFCDEL